MSNGPLLSPTIELKAPKGKFRTTGYDSFSHEDWIYGDHDTLEEARMFATIKGRMMNIVYIWDDKGNRVGIQGNY